MLNIKDPIKTLEDETKIINDSASRITNPILQRYPLAFALLLTFALASIIHGFEMILKGIPLLEENPSLLIVLGLMILIFTGKIYKILGKN